MYIYIYIYIHRYGQLEAGQLVLSLAEVARPLLDVLSLFSSLAMFQLRPILVLRIPGSRFRRTTFQNRS